VDPVDDAVRDSLRQYPDLAFELCLWRRDETRDDRRGPVSPVERGGTSNLPRVTAEGRSAPAVDVHVHEARG
jgi:hypothetical protein